MPAPAEDLPSSFNRTQPYPGIDIARYIGKYEGKVVFITGASRGIGERSARAFAKAGANLFIVARNGATLDKVKREIEAENPSVKVGTAVVDVSKPEDVKAGVEAAVALFGRIDFVISNAAIGGTDFGNKLGVSNVEEWLSVIDVNYKGSYIVARYTIPELVKTKGYFIFVSSKIAQWRMATTSSYSTAKHALNRLCEFVVEEHGEQGVKAFSMHPGAVLTDMNAALLDIRHYLVDSPDLAAYTQVRLVSGSEDWLSGRYVSANWDLDELAKYKEQILEADALKNRLALPAELL